jgi:hypothetical protein
MQFAFNEIERADHRVTSRTTTSPISSRSKLAGLGIGRIIVGFFILLGIGGDDLLPVSLHREGRS